MPRALHRRDDPSRVDGPDRTELDCAALLYRDGQSEERRFLLEDNRPRRLVGRSPRCDLVIDWDDLVSREHAWLELVGERWLVSDDGLSRNGTYLNGERLTSGRRLSHGDRLLIGRTLLAFRAPTPTSQTAGPTKNRGEPLASLTEMQRQVLRALCTPLRSDDRYALPATNQQIATELCVAEETVKSHLKELFRRLRIEDALGPTQKRMALARQALNSGLV